MPSGLDRLQVVLGQVQVPERVLSFGISLEVDDQAISPPAQMGGRHRHVRTALSSAPVQHMECDRVLAEVKVRLGLDAKLVSPSVREVSMPCPHSLVPVIDSATRYRHGRAEFDLRIAERDEVLYVARVESLYRAAVKRSPATPLTPPGPRL